MDLLIPSETANISESGEILERTLILHSAYIRVLVLCYLGGVILVGIIGNLVVLYGSLLHGALRLDPTSLILVHVMCCSDILAVLLFFLPIFTSIIWGRWVLGYGVCGVVGFFKTMPAANQLLTVLAMSGYRLWKVWKKNLAVPANIRTRILALTLLNLATAASIPLIMVFWKLATHDPAIYAYFTGTSCQSSNYELVLEPGNTSPGLPGNHGNVLPGLHSSSSASLTRLLTRLFLGLLTGLGVMLTVLLNLSTAVLAWTPTRRAGHGVPQRTMVTLGAVAWTFSLSYTPVLSYTMWSMRRPGSYRGFLLLSHCCLGMNVLANPLIYAISNKRFRSYVSSRFSVAQFSNTAGRRDSRRSTLSRVGECSE